MNIPRSATFQDLLLLSERTPILWLGAGASRQADPPLPTLAQLVTTLCERFQWKPLRKDEAEILDEFITTGPASRGELDDFLEEQIRPGGRSSRPGRVHVALAALAKSGFFKAIIDTNYDLLLRQQMEAVGARFLPQVADSNAHIASDAPRYHSIHGTYDEWKTVILTAQSYAEFDEKSRWLKAQLDTLLRQQGVLFVGCSLMDPRILDWISGLSEGDRAHLKTWIAMMTEGGVSALRDRISDERVQALCEHVRIFQLSAYEALPQILERLVELKSGGVSTDRPQSSPRCRQLSVHQFALPIKMVGRHETMDEVTRTLLAVEGSSSHPVGSAVRVLSLIAMGGVGKSTVARQSWLRCAASDRFEVAVWYSFYDESARDEAVFFAALADALECISPERPRLDAAALRREIFRKIAKTPILLVLDGLEVIQDLRSEASPRYGELLDTHRHLEQLLNDVLASEQARVLVTSRVLLWNLAGAAGHHAIELDLLPQEDAIALLSSLGVRGGNREMHDLSRTLGGHALCLRAAGMFMRKYKITPAQFLEDVVGDQSAFSQTHEGERVVKIVGAIRRHLSSGQEFFLKMLSLHNRPITESDFPVVVDGWVADDVQAAPKARSEVVRPLLGLGLITLLRDESGASYTAHPLMKFAYANWWYAREVPGARLRWAAAAVKSPDEVSARSATPAQLDELLVAIENYIAGGRAEVGWAIYENGGVHHAMHWRGQMPAMRDIMRKFTRAIDEGQWAVDINAEEAIYRCIKTSCCEMGETSTMLLYGERHVDAVKRRGREGDAVYADLLMSNLMAVSAQFVAADEALEKARAKLLFLRGDVRQRYAAMASCQDAEIAALRGDFQGVLNIVNAIDHELLSRGDRERWSAFLCDALIDAGRYEEATRTIKAHLRVFGLSRSGEHTLHQLAVTSAIRMGNAAVAGEHQARVEELAKSMGIEAPRPALLLLLEGDVDSALEATELRQNPAGKVRRDEDDLFVSMNRRTSRACVLAAVGRHSEADEILREVEAMRKSVGGGPGFAGLAYAREFSSARRGS